MKKPFKKISANPVAKRLFLKRFFTTEITKITEKKSLKISVDSVFFITLWAVVNALFFYKIRLKKCSLRIFSRHHWDLRDSL